MNEPTEDDSNPLVFISHRHEDAALADALREWIVHRTAIDVDVLQTSNWKAENIRIGGDVNRELLRQLRLASLVILLYTTPGPDWEYCFWECGAAMSNTSVETKLVVFDCGREPPQVFHGVGRTSMRNLNAMCQFADQFLTKENFLPGLTRVSKYRQGSEEIRVAGQDLFERFAAILPPVDTDVDWPAHPFIKLALPMDAVAAIVAASPEKRLSVATDLITEKAYVVDNKDQFAGKLFGGRIEENQRLHGLLQSWKEGTSSPRSRWYEALCDQMTSAARNGFPPVRWELMRSADPNDSAWYAPAVTYVRTTSRGNRMEFDVYFCRFDMGPDGRVKMGGEPGLPTPVADPPAGGA